jgi:hypothetical protein
LRASGEITNNLCAEEWMLVDLIRHDNAPVRLDHARSLLELYSLNGQYVTATTEAAKTGKLFNHI